MYYLEPDMTRCQPNNIKALQVLDRVAPQPLNRVVAELSEVVRAHKQRGSCLHCIQIYAVPHVVAVAQPQGVMAGACVQVVMIRLHAQGQRMAGMSNCVRWCQAQDDTMPLRLQDQHDAGVLPPPADVCLTLTH